MKGLREELQRITEAEPDVSRHPELIERLRTVYSHTIHFASDPKVAHIALDRYNCYAYAFGIAESLAVNEISTTFSKTTFLNEEFMAWLADHHLRQIPDATVSKDGIVLYSDKLHITHAGILKGGRVVSKWGEGHILSHALLEVPLSYGDNFRVYQSVKPAVAEKAFITYAKEREGTDLVAGILKWCSDRATWLWKAPDKNQTVKNEADCK